MNREPLNRNLRIRLTEKEDLGLVWLAKNFGEKTRSRIVRKMIREALGQGPDLLKDDLNAFREAVRQVAALGRNINQIARFINSGQLNNLGLDSQLLETVDRHVTSLKNELVAVVKRTRFRWINRD